MKRRDFLRYGATLSALPVALDGYSLHAITRHLFLKPLTSVRPDRKLVLVQLNGGNDGLSTFVPLDQYDNLQKARPNIIIPENNLISFTDSIGLHPYFGKVKTMYEEEQMLIIQNVGYPQPNLSHFRSKDIVTSGSSAQEVIRSGWMGRVLNSVHPDYPTGYPNESNPHPIALTIGSTASQTCQGYTSNLSAVIKGLNTTYQAPGDPGTYPDTPHGKEMQYIAGVMERTEVYLEAIGEVASRASNLSNHYPASGNNLANQLKIVARLIAGGLNTQIYVVSLGGWDTHADQTEEGLPEGGRHRELLTKLSDAIYAFQDDLKLLGVEDDVLSFVFTEFGRRIKSNASFGTDHGTAWPAMLFGSMVNPTIMGSNPVIPDTVGKDDNLAMQFDFRSVYGSILKKWFEADDELIQQVLSDPFETLPILRTETGIPVHSLDPLFELYPNPVESMVQIKLEVVQGKVTLRLFSSNGKLIKILMSRDMSIGVHALSMDFSGLEPGSYYLGMTDGTNRRSIPFIKL